MHAEDLSEESSSFDVNQYWLQRSFMMRFMTIYATIGLFLLDIGRTNEFTHLLLFTIIYSA